MIPGTLVAGRYAVLRALGEGGMGQVFEVQHRALGRRFALKVLRADLANAVLLRRFEREAQALARVSTARVAQVTDFGIDPEVGPFYVMELLEGETLGDRLDREGRLAVGESAELAIEVAEALVEVHEASLVHRDLKPSNIGLPRRGPVRAKLLDFGLAAVLEGGNPRLTKSQELLGSLPYMAPEQFMGSTPTPAMDLYALGVCAYEMMTGRLPFDADSSAALMHQILTRPVPPLDDARLGIAVPAPLAAVVLRLLAREPAARYPSARAAAQALRAASIGPSREPTLQDAEQAAMPQTRPTPAHAAAGNAAADAMAPTVESESVPPPRPPSGDAATLLVAKAIASDTMPVTERRVPSTIEVPAAIRTKVSSVAGVGGGRRALAWAAGLVAAGGAVALGLWLAAGAGTTAAAPTAPPRPELVAPLPPARPGAPAPPVPATPVTPTAPASASDGADPAVAPVLPVAPLPMGAVPPRVAAEVDAGPGRVVPVAPVPAPPAKRPRPRRGGGAAPGWNGEIIERP